MKTNIFPLAALCAALFSPQAFAEDDPDPAEIAIGERLFLETRFAQAHAERPGKPDPALDLTATGGAPLPGPFAGKTMNCRACHLVDEHAQAKNGGMRSYADFAPLAPIPSRGDGVRVTERNSQALVNIAPPEKPNALFHFDGEFASLEDLVRGTFTGRNFGWLPGEQAKARAHIAKLVREDDGTGELAREFGGAYKTVLAGTDPKLAAHLRLPAEYRVDANTATDSEILDALAKLVAAYTRDLGYARDEQGRYTGSPYDRFLAKNQLPRKPEDGESDLAYSRRLAKAAGALTNPIWISPKDGGFDTHKQTFAFGVRELRGMRIFFRESGKRSAGNCIACHAAPHFSDYGFHNTGITQNRYDAVHGAGAFAALAIPDLKTRQADHNAWLPAGENHPKASGRFRSHIDKTKPGRVDLGVWNVYANPDMPGPRTRLHAQLCLQKGGRGCATDSLLNSAVAAFKTPVLRDLGHSQPYMHSGHIADLKTVIAAYIANAELARAGKLRNADPALQAMHLGGGDIEALVAFLNALNEDYD